MLGGIGTVEIIVIAIILLLFFGGRKLPELTRGITDAIREFRMGIKEEDDGKKKR